MAAGADLPGRLRPGDARARVRASRSGRSAQASGGSSPASRRRWIEDSSKRRAEIEEKLALRKGSLDAADSRYAELVAKETRRTKDTEKPRHELFEKWQGEAREHGITPEFIRGQLQPGVKLSELSPEVRDARKEDALEEDDYRALSEQTLALERGRPDEGLRRASDGQAHASETSGSSSPRNGGPTSL